MKARADGGDDRGSGIRGLKVRFDLQCYWLAFEQLLVLLVAGELVEPCDQPA